jgi:PAP2 superfamily
MTPFTTPTGADADDRFVEPAGPGLGRSNGAASWRRAWPGWEFLRCRPPLWMEAAVVVWLLWIYDAVNNLSHVRVAEAVGHAASVLHLEHTLHIAVELRLSHVTSTHHLFALIIADYYDNAHFVVTFGVLAWLWIAKPDRYRDMRRALVLINLIGFAVFLVYPMAPPRMLPGFIDTVAATHALGSWHSGVLAPDANQYAAMPSLHLAWATWSCTAVRSTARYQPARATAAIYPSLTFFAVVATANHLVIDSLAGVATASITLGSNHQLARMSCTIRGAIRAR